MARTLSFILLGSAIATAGGTVEADDDTHVSSPELSAKISAGLPKFIQKTAEGTVAARAATPAAKQAGTDPSISILPTVTVTETRAAPDERILTNSAKAAKVVNAYMGDSDGLDRAVLNRFTLQQLWKKIPILGRLPFVGTPAAMTNEERAFDRAGYNDPLGRPHPPPDSDQ
jgi:hypothetical protein